jgi:hypothetical protein
MEMGEGMKKIRINKMSIVYEPTYPKVGDIVTITNPLGYKRKMTVQKVDPICDTFGKVQIIGVEIK